MLVSCYENGRNSFTSGQKLTICAQVISGMKYLVASGFTHKDLAARNCVVGADLEVKIGFLSLSYDLYNAEYYRFNNMLIPLRWMAPEAIFDDEFSEKSDVWSFGVLIWEVYTLGSLPYHDRPDEEVLKCVRDDLRLPQPDNCPDNMVEMMRRCWENNPDHRPTLSELADEISSINVDSHVWLLRSPPLRISHPSPADIWEWFRPEIVDVHITCCIWFIIWTNTYKLSNMSKDSIQ